MHVHLLILRRQPLVDQQFDLTHLLMWHRNSEYAYSEYA